MKTHELTLLAHQIPNPIIVINVLGIVEYANPAAQGLLDHWKIKVGQTLPKIPYAKCQMAIGIQQTAFLEILTPHQIYYCRFVPMSEQTQVIIYGFEVSQHQNLQSQLLGAHQYDEITGLPNRKHFLKMLDALMLEANDEKTTGALLLIDLNQFNTINQTLGHQVADKLLEAVANRLLFTVPQGYPLARLGDNQFGVIRMGILDDADPANLSQIILDNIGQPYSILGHDIVISARVGIALFPARDEDTASIIRHATLALTRAKETHGNSFEFYVGYMSSAANAKSNLLRDLRFALAEDQLLLFYQPQYALPTHKVIGMEALVRWQHPTHGLMTPGRFTSLAEQSGLILSIGEWVMNVACRQTQHWKEQGYDLRVSVNISALQFKHQDLVKMVEAALAKTKLLPELLVLEITESALIENIKQAREVLQQLNRIGVKLAIDDFGVGYSSFNYLQRLPVHKLKIDKSFIFDIDSDNENQTVVDDVIKMAHKLNMEVIAEGVEKKSQLEFLTTHLCEEVQGFFFSEPLSFLAFDAYLQKQKR